MWRRTSCVIAVFATAAVGMALAADVPAPVKKPRDKSGAADTRPSSSKKSPDTSSQKTNAKPASGNTTGSATADQKSKTASPSEQAKKSDPSNKPSGTAKSGETTGKDKIPVETSGKTPPATTPPPPALEWTGTEIEAAKTHCATILKGIDAVAIPEPPKKDGNCGSPAPFRLVSIGSSPQVALDPPALLTCDMIVALTKWMKGDLQPLAKKHLGSEIIKIETMSDYSCRAAYGRVGNKLSEHAYANALDIRGFMTAKAERAYVLESWGATQRDIEAKRLAAAKAEADKKAAAETAAASKQPDSTSAASSKLVDNDARPQSNPTPAVNGATSSTAEQKPGFLKSTITPLADTKSPKAVDPSATGLGFQAPSRLGGPKDKKEKTDQVGDKLAATTDAPTAGPKGRMALFLREAHGAACKIFGTTLGPEANNDHRNHFHVDMAARKSKKICD